MELEAQRFYSKAAEQATDVGVRKLLGDLAELEKGHESLAVKLTDDILTPDIRSEEDKTRRRMFILQYIQPGLAGLMDGSVSTLAPLFAAAFATHNNWQTFLVGLAASIGAGVSMGFAEALSDDGSLTGRGSPWLRGGTCGVMTTIGGLGHTMPYLVPDTWANAFWIATAIAIVVVFFELWAIAYVRARYMDTPFLQAAFQVVLGGELPGRSGARSRRRSATSLRRSPSLPAAPIWLAAARRLGAGDLQPPGRRHLPAHPRFGGGARFRCSPPTARCGCTSGRASRWCCSAFSFRRWSRFRSASTWARSASCRRRSSRWSTSSAICRSPRSCRCSSCGSASASSSA